MTSSSTSRAGPPAGGIAGRVLAGRYRLVRSIASGGMAEVWEGIDQVLARRVAVKVLHPHLALDESFVRRFEGEAVAAARLAHPSIVSVYDTLTDDGVNAIVMELVTGTTLRADIDQHGPLTITAVLAIGSQVADALSTAHASRLVHRDVKPANILLSGDGRVLVADFGIAKAAADSDLTSDGTMIGTAKYLAPEQVTGGGVDGRTDLYALGVTLYEALTGQAPFVGDNDTSTAIMRLRTDPVPLRHHRPDVPPAVEAVVQRAMARDPDDRFSSASAMRHALLAAGADPSQAAAAVQAAVERQPDRAARHHPIAPASASAPFPAAPSSHRVDPAPAHGSVPPESSRGRGGWLALLMVLIGLALAVAATPRLLSQGPTSHQPLPIESFASFDPHGGDGEMDHLLSEISADPDTFWRTEHYNGHRDVLDYKGGVGLRVALVAPATVRELTLTTALGGWSADIYAHAGPTPDGIEGWGEPIGRLFDIETGPTTTSLEPTRADQVLIWFTYLSPEFTATIVELEMAGT